MGVYIVSDHFRSNEQELSTWNKEFTTVAVITTEVACVRPHRVDEEREASSKVLLTQKCL